MKFVPPRLPASLSGPVFVLAVLAIISSGCGGGPVEAEPVDIPGPVELATFAGGCFWCMEPPFEGLPGVRSVVSGYSGGPEIDPRYEEVARGLTGHTECVQIDFNPEILPYEELLEIYWRSADPTDAGGQFADRGRQYRPAIFYHSEEQRVAAEASRDRLEAQGPFDEPIVVEITAFEVFYVAEEYHQDYYRKNPVHYNSYAIGSGRKGFLKRTWGSEPYQPKTTRHAVPVDEDLLSRLTPLQYDVTQRDATEPPYRNEYWDEVRDGIYVDVVSGEPLFASLHKYRSGTGWPSFDRPLVEQNVVEHRDFKLLVPRTEVRSRRADSHLGHVFSDGPRETTGLRYCINSAALRFVPVEHLEAEGYAEFTALFET